MPRPATFTEANNSFAFWVKFDKSKAAGTLLIIWLESKPARYVAKELSNIPEKTKDNFSIEEIEPVNKKNPTKVKRRL